MCTGERFGIVVQARLNSSRLPRKALHPIRGKSLLYRLCDRMTQSREAQTLLVATSDQPQDKEIQEVCRARGIPVFRGPERDLTSRLLGAAQAHNLTAFVRVTGDNPLTDPEGIDELISTFRADGADYVHNAHRSGYPYGTGAEVVRTSALARCDRELQDEDERENFIIFMRQHPDTFPCVRLSAPAHLLRPEYFLTVDYQEDVQLMSRIYAEFDGRDDVKLTNIIDFLDANPKVAALNRYRHSQFPE